MNAFKKLIFVTTIVTSMISTSVLAGREEFGTFGGWDTYRLDLNKPTVSGTTQLCAVRGVYDTGYKTIFAFNNDNSIKFYVEHEGWSLPPGFRKAVRIEVLDKNNETIFYDNVLLSNEESIPVKQFKFNVNAKFIKAVLLGYVVAIHGNELIKFNINDQDLNDAISSLANNCLPTMTSATGDATGEVARPMIRKVVSNPF